MDIPCLTLTPKNGIHILPSCWMSESAGAHTLSGWERLPTMPTNLGLRGYTWYSGRTLVDSINCSSSI